MRLSILTLILASVSGLLSARELPPLPVPVTSFGAVVCDGYLYAYGGHQAGSHSWSKETTSDKLIRLKIGEASSAWEEVATGPAVQSPGLAVANGKVILIAGMQPQNQKGEDPVLKSQDHVLSFDPKTGKWTELPKLPDVRSSHDVAVYENKLYVVGGWPLDTTKDDKDQTPDDRSAERSFHHEMLVLDLTKPESGWQKIPHPFARRALAAVASQGKIYALGGMNPKNEVTAEADVYDIASGQWSKLPEIPSDGHAKAFAAAACELNGEVIVSPQGGKLYALRNDKWVEAGKLSEPRFFHQLEPDANSTVIALGGTAGKKPVASVEAATVNTVK